MTSLTFITFGFDISIFMFIESEVRHTWNLTELEYAIYPAVTGVTNVLGSVFISILTDYYGRVWPYSLTLTIVGVFGIADAFSPTYAVLIILRCLASFGIGAIYAVSYPTFVEFLPRYNRGKAQLLSNLFPAIGLCASAGLAWWLIPTYPLLGWRYFIIAAMSPSLLAAMFRLAFYFQSPRYLISKNKVHKAWKVFDTMAWMNGKNLSTYVSESQFVSTISSGMSTRAPLSDLVMIFKRPYLRRTLCLFGLLSTEALGYAGATLFLPQELRKLNVNSYFSVLVAFIAQIPGILLMSIIVEWEYIGRLNSLRFFSLIATVFFFLLAFVQTDVTIPVFLIFIYFSVFPIQTLLLAYISESYPTNIRSLTVAFFSIVLAVFLIITPFLSAYIVSLHHRWLYWTVWGGMFALNFVFSLILNYEPHKKNLLDIVT